MDYTGSHIPVHNGFPVQMLEATADLSGVKLHPVSLETRRAHIVDVKLQVSAVHDGQHQTQGVFGLVGVR